MKHSKPTAPPSATITDPQLLAALHDRAAEGQSAGSTATRDLARYYRLLREQLATISLTEGEAMLIHRALETARAERFPSLVDAVAAEAERQPRRQTWPSPAGRSSYGARSRSKNGM
jgi:hypothetical protein